MLKELPFESLKGKTITEIQNTAYKDDFDVNDALIFTTQCGSKYVMTHMQDCCERVNLVDVCGDFNDIKGEEILLAACVSSEFPRTEADNGTTWTFYHLATIKGSVCLRWKGESNGYYSEDVGFYEEKGATLCKTLAK